MNYTEQPGKTEKDKDKTADLRKSLLKYSRLRAAKKGLLQDDGE